MSRTQRPYEVIDFPPLTKEQNTMLEDLSKVPDSEIDTSDIPECSGNGGFYYIQSLKMPQTRILTVIDNDTLAWLKNVGKGYQQRLNNVLRWARMNNCPVEQL